jgi:hypothetical protein
MNVKEHKQHQFQVNVFAMLNAVHLIVILSVVMLIGIMLSVIIASLNLQLCAKMFKYYLQ